MRKTFWILGPAMVVPMVVSAQAVPRVEVFGGYSYMQVRGYAADESLFVPGSGTVSFPSFGSNGWATGVAVNVTRWFGVAADISGLYGMPTKTIGGAPITIGMRELLGARRIRLYTETGSWKQTILRILLFSEPTVDYPVTLVHGHPDVEVIVDAASAACPRQCL